MTISTSSVRPDARFLVSHPAHFIALGFGSGLAPAAPGTFGTLLGWLMYVVAGDRVSPTIWSFVVGLGFFLGVWACRKTGSDLGSPDHGAMVWDEMIAIWLVLLFTPGGLAWQIAAFVLFRGFDIIKPPPIRYFDRVWKGGFGVMWDDILAAFYSLLVIALMVKLYGSLWGL